MTVVVRLRRSRVSDDVRSRCRLKKINRVDDEISRGTPVVSNVNLRIFRFFFVEKYSRELRARGGAGGGGCRRSTFGGKNRSAEQQLSAPVRAPRVIYTSTVACDGRAVRAHAGTRPSRTTAAVRVCFAEGADLSNRHEHRPRACARRVRDRTGRHRHDYNYVVAAVHPRRTRCR